MLSLVRSRDEFLVMLIPRGILKATENTVNNATNSHGTGTKDTAERGERHHARVALMSVRSQLSMLILMETSVRFNNYGSSERIKTTHARQL